MPEKNNRQQMITGLGTDIIEVERVAAKIKKERGFRELVFTPKEIEYCETKSNKFEHYAARFAAKEAFLKALGTGWTSGTAFNEIQITHDQEGRPQLDLIGLTAQSAATLNIGKILVSIAHLKSVATAVVIIEK
jgi:holo-[acyl-carrier protein] synthase